MATLEALRHYFDSPTQEKSLLDALTALRRMKTINPVDLASFTEIFGELHFKENNPLEDSPQSVVLDDGAPSSSSSTTAYFSSDDDSSQASSVALVDDEARDVVPKTGESFLKNTKNLQMCTEGLGSESGGDVDESPHSSAEGSSEPLGNQSGNGQRMKDINRRSKYEGFPPPISSIGRNGQPWVSFRSYREDGRFVLREIRMPNQEFLHASREDGRLKLRFIQRDDDLETDAVEEEEETNDDGDDPEMGGAQQAQLQEEDDGGGDEGEKRAPM
ncbi:protein FANTASTIC FOUR 3 [Nymphaea colorata]|uniref:FAF domain-containing protein n=1 Tax=Nymphaea colorata TaxID=210225 RepID=A0A5K0V9X6_9MAGN|nr:protein FANTASTIC FOUR 3 [Nymphaea colorata]